MIKKIKFTQVERVAAEKVRPGDMILEGVVLDVERVGDEIYMSTVLGDVAAPITGTVQVYARLASPDMVEAARHAIRDDLP